MREHYKKLVSFLIMMSTINIIGYSQSDTLFVNNFDTIQININEPFYKVVDFGAISGNTKIILYFHLKCSDTTNTLLRKVYTGDGGCYFNSLSEIDQSLPGLFRNQEFWGEIIYIRKGDFKVKRNISFKFYNKDIGEWDINFQLIGKREH